MEVPTDVENVSAERLLVQSVEVPTDVEDVSA